MFQKFKSACLSKKCNQVELIVFLIYCIGVSVITYFHEPWFDEAQAWLIARDATLKEILFDVPHYEGHPQLWHFLLVPFAKLGAPYELSLYLVNFAFMAATVALLLWKSPFPKFIRCILPFNFFVFYQYGVISRPYSMMFLAVVLASMFYADRNKMPVRYILILCFLCMTSAYGILIAGGICMIWTWEIFQEYRKNHAWKKVIADSRAYALTGILLLAIVLVMMIYPAEDCYYAGYNNTLSDTLKYAVQDWRLILLIPFDSLIGCTLTENGNFYTLSGEIAEYIGGAALLLLTFLFLHENKKAHLFLVPFGMLMFFFIIKYYTIHHTGICALPFLFAFWQMFRETVHIPKVFSWIKQHIDSRWTYRLGYVLLLFVLLASPASTVTSSVMEIQYTYGMKEVVNFIKENHLENAQFMSNWSVFANLKKGNTIGERKLASIVWDETLPAWDLPELTSSYPCINGLAAACMPYFDHNMFINYNEGKQDHLYMKWLNINKEESEPIYETWRSQGLPDFCVGLVPLQEVYSEQELEGVTYYMIDTVHSGKIFKFTREEGYWNIYIRSDLLDEYPQFEIQTYAKKAKEPT